MTWLLIIYLSGVPQNHTVDTFAIYPALSSTHVRYVERGASADCALDPAFPMVQPAPFQMRVIATHCTSDRIFDGGFE